MAIDVWTRLEGRWRGTYRLHDPRTGRPLDSASEATIAPVLQGSLVRIDYTWDDDGTPHEGSMLVGFHDGRPAMHWSDTWHYAGQVMGCTGDATGGSIDVRGSYAAPPGPDWGWRTVLAPDGEGWTMTMWNVLPDGAEHLAVEVTYTRA